MLTMRICHVVPWIPLPPNTGGLETYLSLLIAKQVESGHRVSVIGRTRQTNHSNTTLENDAVTYHVLPSRKFPHAFPIQLSNVLVMLNLFVSTLLNIPLIIRRLHQIKPNIVYFYEFYHGPTSLLCRFLGYPSVLGHFVFQPYWRSFLPNRTFSVQYAFWFVILRSFSVVYTQATQLIGPNVMVPNYQWLRTIMGQHRAYYLPGSIDPQIVTAIQSHPEVENWKRRGDHVILCPRRLVPGKGVHVLLHAIPKIIRKKSNARIIFTGTGPLLPWLKNEAVKLGIEQTIRFTGNLSYPILLQYISSADIVVIPSLTEETLGIAILEAYAFHKPVIGTRIGGIPNVVENQHSGLLVEPDNREELAHAIVTLLDAPDLRARMGQRGYVLATTRYNITRTVHALEQIHHTLHAS
jgi:glycosyltransferase involved in cell wall biosynthesis